MIDSNFIIYNLFRLINFGVLVGFGFYVVRRYILGTVREEIKQKNSKEVALQKEFSDLGNLYKEHEIKLEKQEKLCLELQQKIFKWSSVFENQKKLEEKEQLQFLKNIEGKIKIQQQYLLEEKIIETVVPQAIKNAQKELKEYFSLDQNSQKFITKFLGLMRKSNV